MNIDIQSNVHNTVETVWNKSNPNLMNLLCLYLPAKDPYATTKWYCDVFELDPSVLDRGSPDGFVNGNPYTTYSMYYLLSQDELKLHFEANGSVHTSIRLKVNHIDNVYRNMMQSGTEILTDGIVRSDDGDWIRFKDIDGRLLEVVHTQINLPESEQSVSPSTIPLLYGLQRLSLPAKDPYFTYKWYCDVFGFEPSMNDTDADLCVLDHPNFGYSLHFLRSDNQLQHQFHNREGYNHTYLLLQVKDIDQIFASMKSLGVEIVNDAINDRGGCGQEIRFIDPDGRTIEINDYGTR
ncbi:VOC family protein [Paenibacillus spongiae]|uniref:VOC family protein n=1 Tax=Paenibacillus spongiae TaxID=2909671 RepID=A0ABY5SHL9_9BACL|nr:VOC family protein [Paenibacillus spongiae]UVI33244.1 VOC family protein [Paenibacillus spongiae]